ncbi:MAG TPA: hypothetical protein VGK96_28280 [Candidatus Sulfotelmatobacter sp.]
MTTPITTYFPAVGLEVEDRVRYHLQLIYQKLNNHAQAIAAVHGTATAAASSRTVVVASSPSGGGGSPVTSIGTVNDQSGQTAYTTQPGDNGATVILNDASPIAITLSNGVSSPYLVFLENQGTGLATLTPMSGTISYAFNPAAASMPLAGGYFAIVTFTGSDFFATTCPIVPITFNAVAHEWINSYNASTGAFTATQPAYADISGTPVLPATVTPVAGEYLVGYDATTGLFSVSTPAGLSVTIITAALTLGGTQGSMTFSGGRLTAQTPAT